MRRDTLAAEMSKAVRRRFTIEYNRTIVLEADACKTPGVPKKGGPTAQLPDPRDEQIPPGSNGNEPR